MKKCLRGLIIILCLFVLGNCGKFIPKKKAKIDGPNVKSMDLYEPEEWDGTPTSAQRPSGSLVEALNKITSDYERRAEIITFVNSELNYEGRAYYEELAYEFHGVSYSFDVNGKYLFAAETAYGGSGSSYEDTKMYIFDTELLKVIPLESILINTSDNSFKNLVIEYLSKLEDFEMFHEDLLLNSISDLEFNLFYAKNGVGFMWGKGTISANAFGPVEIIIPYSIAQKYLTPLGKEIFK